MPDIWSSSSVSAFQRVLIEAGASDSAEFATVRSVASSVSVVLRCWSRLVIPIAGSAR
jgi:hypothetical protein